MLAELFLVLSGHPSSFFVPSPSPPSSPFTLVVAPSLSQYLHPGEISSLNSLAHLAFQYSKIHQWAKTTQLIGLESILNISIKTDRTSKPLPTSQIPDQYLSTLAGGILDFLKTYQQSLVEIEDKILSCDTSTVQDESGYVPLSLIQASLSKWFNPLSNLSSLIDKLSQHPHTPSELIELIYTSSLTGNPQLEEIYKILFQGLKHLFLTHLTVFLLYGIAPSVSTSQSPVVALDKGSDPLSPQYRLYVLNEDVIPRKIGKTTREGILYVGRVTATLKREGKSLPKLVLDELRDEIMNVSNLEEGGGLERAIGKARLEVGEWLWKHVLTGNHVIDALQAFGDYFLTRNGPFTHNLIRQISLLRVRKLITSNPHSSSSVIKDQDLSHCLTKASISTLAEYDKFLDKLHLHLPQGPIRPLMSVIPISNSIPNPYLSEIPIRDLFSTFPLGSPLILETRVSWPLDLFLSPSSMNNYTDIHTYLFAFRETHMKVLECWTFVSSSQRQRRKWTGTTEGGSPLEAKERQQLVRSAWGVLRIMLFFLDQMLGHFLVDIIDVQHRQLLSQLEGISSHKTSSETGSLRGSMTRPRSPIDRRNTPTTSSPDPMGRPGSPGSFHTQWERGSTSRAPPTPGKPQTTHLDFLTLRQMHSRHLAFLREGLLIADRTSAALIRDILMSCRRFTALVDRWGGDVLPELLVEGSAEEVTKLLKERQMAVQEVADTLRDQLTEFFRMLVESQNPSLGDTSTSGTSRTNASKINLTHASRILSRHTSFKGVSKNKTGPTTAGKEDTADADSNMSRHIEQLLLRLDFNGVLTSWLVKEERGGQTQNILAEGGLSPAVR
ncbi:hypothetical protein M231_07316 [Tremella mesenterica]|uniref:Spindle pole body component n=1 Tax=Tremella mesenterica TaxID=5217 RepID=A0A4Q1B9L5_TREME|nr:hypothetical protein M231_07316 [Tremella mesenterica]